MWEMMLLIHLLVESGSLKCDICPKKLIKWGVGITEQEAKLFQVLLKGLGHVTVNNRFVRDRLRVWGILFTNHCVLQMADHETLVGLPFLSPEFEWDQISCQVWVVLDFSISFQQFPLFVDLCLHVNASLSFLPNDPVGGSLLLACCTAKGFFFVDWSIKNSQNICFW